MPDNGNGSRKVLWVSVLVGLAVFLLVALVMIGVPYVNAHLAGGTGVSSKDLASWQISALIAVVGMLIAGVFVITAFRLDATAKHTAFNEAGKVARDRLRGVRKRIERRIEKTLAGATSDLSTAVDEANNITAETRARIRQLITQSEAEIAKLVDDGNEKFGQLVEKGSAEIDRVFQNAEMRTTNAIQSESDRFRQATDAVVAGLEREFRALTDQLQADNRAVREFVDERAPGVVLEAFTPERLEAIEAAVVAKLTDEFVIQRIDTSVRAFVDEQPDRLVDPVVERVAARARWRWLLRRDDSSAGKSS